MFGGEYWALEYWAAEYWGNSGNIEVDNVSVRYRFNRFTFTPYMVRE